MRESQLETELQTENGAGRRPGTRSSGRRVRGRVRSIWWYIVPFVLINAVIFYFMTAQPDFTLQAVDNGDYKTEDVTVTLKRSLLPLKSFTAQLDDEEITMDKVSAHEYRTVIKNNGTLEVSAEFPNGMIRTQYASISAIDDVPPTITGQEIVKNVFTVSLEDTQSGVNPASVYAVDADGKRIAPMASGTGKQDSSEARFQTQSDSLEVHASDQCGNEAVVSFDGLTALGNGGTDRSSDYNTYGEEESESSSSSKSSTNNTSSKNTSTKSTSSKNTSSKKSSSKKSSSS